MRIVSGKYRGRSIDAPSGDGTRPTTDRVREALMSSLKSLRGGLDDAVVLDGFAGSGALGLEALSRGAQSAVFFESDRAAQRVIERNIAKLNIDSRSARLVKRDFLKTPLSRSAAPFDLVFLDPPYAFDAKEVLGHVSSLISGGAVSPEAIVVYEHALDDAASVEQAASEYGFSVAVFKKYGKTGVTTMTGLQSE